MQEATALPAAEPEGSEDEVQHVRGTSIRAGQDRRRRLSRPALVAGLLLALLATTLVLLNVHLTPGLSPFDEATHLDYVERVTEGRLPARGDVLSQSVLAEWACRGSASGTLPLPECGDRPYDPSDFPAGGSQYNSAHPPLYYAVTAAGATAVSSVTGYSLLEAARLTGIGWLVAGLWVLLAALRRLGASWTVATSVGALVALAPAVMHPTSTVNNDASAVLAGALVLWVGLRVLHGASSWPAFAAAAIVVAALKFVFVVALVPVGVVLLLHAVRTPAHRARVARTLGAGLLAAAVPILVWTLVQADRGTGDAENPVLGINTRDADRLPVAATLKNLLNVWPPVTRAFPPAGLEQPQMFLWVALVPILFASAPLLGLVAARRVTGRDVSLGAALGMLTVPVVVQLHTYATHAQYFPDIAPRYGLSLVPAVVLALASSVRGRADERVLAALAGLGAFAVVVALLTTAA